MNHNRFTAIIAGILFIIATVASLIGSGFNNAASTNGNALMLAALLTFVAAATSAGIAISLYPVLRKYNEGLALGSVAFRLLEAVFYIVGAMCSVLLFTASQMSVNGASQELAQTLRHVLLTAHDLAGFVFGVLAFGIGALMYYYILYQTKLVPRWLSIWGIAAIVALLCAVLFTTFDGEPFAISGALMFLAFPIFLQEMVLAVWLIVKGFNPSAIAAGTARVEMTSYQFAPQN